MSTTTEKQTAVEWLSEQMMHPEIHNPYIAQAKEMEKQQIIDAVDETISEISMYKSSMTYENGKQYYKETFNK
jgi:hypothetical protein